MNLQTNTNYKPSARVEEIGKVLKTYDYSIFKAHIGNRAVNRLHVERLKKSFAERYLISPILVNSSKTIFDGHHRWTAAKEMGLPIYYIVVDGYSHEDMIRLNQNFKKWDSLAYIESYANLNYPEYVKLKNFIKDYSEFGIRSIFTIISLSAWGHRGGTKHIKIDGVSKNVVNTSDFDDGYFVFETEAESRSFCDRIRRIKPYYKKYHTQRFVRSMQLVEDSKNWDFERFLSKLENNPVTISDKPNITEMIDQIEDIFNYKSRAKVSLKYE